MQDGGMRVNTWQNLGRSKLATERPAHSHRASGGCLVGAAPMAATAHHEVLDLYTYHRAAGVVPASKHGGVVGVAGRVAKRRKTQQRDVTVRQQRHGCDTAGRWDRAPSSMDTHSTRWRLNGRGREPEASMAAPPPARSVAPSAAAARAAAAAAAGWGWWLATGLIYPATSVPCWPGGLLKRSPGRSNEVGEPAVRTRSPRRPD